MGLFSKFFSSNNDEEQREELSSGYNSVEEAIGIDFSDISKYQVQFVKSENTPLGGMELYYSLKTDSPIMGIFDKIEIVEYTPEICNINLKSSKQVITQELIDFINACYNFYGKDLSGKGVFKNSENKQISLIRRSWDKVLIDLYNGTSITVFGIKVANLPIPEGKESHLPYTKQSLKRKFGEISDEIYVKGYEDSGKIFSFNDAKKIIIMGEEFDWSDIKGFSYEEKKAQQITTIESKVDTGNMIGRAVVGTLAAGVVGGVVGAVTAKRTQTVSQQDSQSSSCYTLHIYTNIPTRGDISIDLDYIEGVSTEESYKYVISEVQNLISRIINHNS